jgi:TolB-like protein
MTAWVPGVQLGPYELLAPIGAGGMGEVWKAMDTRLKRVVAVKRFKGQHGDRFKVEARAIAALNHPYICQIHDVGPGYLVLEYVEGAPLPCPLETQEALRLAIDIASAVQAAHAKGIIHRDLKPSNILMTPARSIKLLDFGLARLMADADDMTVTIEGSVLGTAAYMSPEQTEGKPLDERSDVFSFGAVLYEMLSGTRPFDRRTTAEVLTAVLHHQPPPLHTLPALEQVVRRCLAKRCVERFQNMSDVRTALEAISWKPAEPEPSIAVLPFATMSANKDDEYFSDGLAEEITSALAQIQGLNVTARTSSFSFRGKDVDIRKIAERLGVRTILEGSVRHIGNRIRVTTQLINAANGYHLWSERYDRQLADVFSIQDDIAQAIASALKVRLSWDAVPARRHTPDIPAYEAFLKARHFLRKGTPESYTRAKALLEQAIALDPNFALADAELASCFRLLASLGDTPTREALLQARAAAARSLEVDPTLPQARAHLAEVVLFLDHDWVTAGRHFELAMAHKPIPSEVSHLTASST